MHNLAIAIEDPMTPDIVGMLKLHLIDMRETSPPDSVHALDVEALQAADITFYSVRQKSLLLGIGALKELTPAHAEIKSMRTTKEARGTGVASFLLDHLIQEGKNRGYNAISLETGTQAFFTPAHHLYKKFGFVECAPFASYKLDPNSLFMEKLL
ncbi:GNAT family N-acetyltransferase [Alteromonas sp. ASW11-130]|uniref:GNAT family N-acetyltransferase n=1 Tax=Alteromonas sp. ASW11-130 TaxID=3015775 RepID=UPI0022419353|nr:GNAT family N-acetyltransferase [Alteromonas sp. ASW11-130]MCW8090834.1 GNAT family N-acetyltransferase [Alteromonas sp. ASW11-130]